MNPEDNVIYRQILFLLKGISLCPLKNVKSHAAGGSGSTAILSDCLPDMANGRGFVYP